MPIQLFRLTVVVMLSQNKSSAQADQVDELVRGVSDGGASVSYWSGLNLEARRSFVSGEDAKRYSEWIREWVSENK